MINETSRLPVAVDSGLTKAYPCRALSKGYPKATAPSTW
jgi:hypothetical protein